MIPEGFITEEALAKKTGCPTDRLTEIIVEYWLNHFTPDLEGEFIVDSEGNGYIGKRFAEVIEDGISIDLNEAKKWGWEDVGWKKGLSQVEIPDMQEMETWYDLSSAFESGRIFVAEISEYNTGGFILYPQNDNEEQDEETQLFCRYKNSPCRYIEDGAKESLLGQKWIVKVAEEPDPEGGNVIVKACDISIYDRLLQVDSYYAALVANTNKSGANVLVDGIVPLFIPNKYIGWKENNEAEKELLSGSWIEIKIIKGEKGLIGSLRDAKINPWDFVGEALPRGTVIDADLISVDPSGVKVKIGVYKGFLPAANISWTEYISDCTLLKFPDPLRVVVLAHDEKKRSIEVSLKDLEPDPWERIEDYIPEDRIVEAHIESIMPHGVRVRVGEKKFLGYIRYRDVDWGKSVDEDTFPFSEGQTVKVKVIDIDKNTRKLNCSLKALKPNPWNELSGLEKIIGKVERVYEDYAEIILPGEIECVCNESLDMNLEHQEIEFQIQYLDVDAQKIAISHRKKEIDDLNILAVGAMFKSDRAAEDETKEIEVVTKEREFHDFIVQEIDASGRVIAKYPGDDKDFKTGILFPTSVTLNDEPVNLLFARHILKTKLKPREIYEFEIIKHYPYLPYAVLSLDIAPLLEIDEISFADLDLLKPGKNVEVTVLEDMSSPYNVFVMWKCYFGFIPRHELEEKYDLEENEKIILTVASSPKHSEQMIRFTVPDSSEEIIKEEDRADRKRIAETLEEELKGIYDIVASIPGYDMENPDTYKHDLELRYDPEKFPELHYKVKEETADLSSGVYYMTFQDKKKGKGRLNFSNSEMEMKAEWKNNEFVITYFRIAQEDEKIITKSPGRPLRINGERLNIVELNSSSQTSDTLSPGEIWAIYEYNRSVVPVLEKLGKEFLRERGKHYLTLQELLSLEKQREEEMAEPEIKISGRPFNEKSGWLGGIALIFNGDEHMFDKIISPDDSEEGTRIFFKADDGEPLIEKGKISKDALFGYLIYEGREKWRIETLPNNEIEPDLTEFKSEGLQVKRFANTRHLNAQIMAIDNYVYGKNGFDIFSKVDNNRLEAPKPLEQEPYMNPRIDRTNPEDSQAKAIRMALGGSRLSLIQGPPGTGKSTVIVDVIKNLVEEGKKVLVCTQSVQPIEELYNKVKSLKGIRAAYIRDQESMEFSTTVDEKITEMKKVGTLLKLMSDFAEDKGISPSDYGEKLLECKRAFAPSYKEAVDTIVKGFSNKIFPEWKEVMSVIEEYINALDQEDVKDFTYNDKQLQIDAVDVVFGTCIGIGVSKALRGVYFDTLILDEAGKANYAETLVPMMLADNYILVGDDQQLPPFTNRKLVEEYAGIKTEEEIQSNKREEGEEVNISYDDIYEDVEEEIIKDVEKSLFGELKNKIPDQNKIMLTKQFRMHPEIGDFVSKLFYDGKVQSMVAAKERTISLEGLQHPIQFIDTSKLGSAVKENKLGTSLYNDGEIDVIESDLVPILVEAKGLGKKVGIISPYGAQVNRMRERFEKYGLQKNVFTIDSIQGEEYDIVVFSFVRNTNHGSLNFIDNINRLNVAFSRARCNLIMVGHLDTLRNENLHAEDADKVKLIYEEINRKKVFKKDPRGGIDKLIEKFPPDSYPLLVDLDHPYYIFEKCYLTQKNKIATYFEGEKIALYNPALESNSIWREMKEENESFSAYLIGYFKNQPYSMLSPMANWLLSNPELPAFHFTANVAEIRSEETFFTLFDGSMISLKVPRQLELREGERVMIHVKTNGIHKKSFTVKRV